MLHFMSTAIGFTPNALLINNYSTVVLDIHMFSHLQFNISPVVTSTLKPLPILSFSTVLKECIFQFILGFIPPVNS